MQTVAEEGKKYTDATKKDAETVANDRQAVEEAAQTVAQQAQEVAQNTQTVATNTDSATKSAQSAQTSAENAAKSAENVQDAVEQIAQNTKDISGLKTDMQETTDTLDTKITKFYASSQGETHLADSDNGKIADMMLYGKSEQKKYQGYQLLKHNTSDYNVTATTAYCGLVDNKPENIKAGTYYLRNLKNTPTVLITFLNESKGVIKQEYLVDKTEKQITFDKDVAYVKYIIQGLTIGTTYKGTVKLILASISNTDYEPYVGGIPSPNPDYPQEIKSVVNPTVKVSNEDGTKSQTITLPYTLNAIPVSAGGNVTIDGQQYVADYVDVERGKLVKMVGVTDQDAFATSEWSSTGAIVIYSRIPNVSNEIAIVTISSKFASDWAAGDEIHHFTQTMGQTLVIILPKTITTVEQGEEIRAKGFEIYYILETPIEIDLSPEEITAFKALSTYYPTTNISINSEQLDGYTVFNYPISMQNGWNYVKQQLNDNRDYIYDMDLQSAEAYVNSEYAVALTELEV